MTELISELKKSPLFNLSLSSKELFHSNFIAWICEEYHSEFGKILADYFKSEHEFIDTNIISVQRETRSLDLTIGFISTSIIIENKVKSVPDKQQLIKYREKSNPNNLFVLLTMIKPHFKVDELGWTLLTYDNLALILKKLQAEIIDEYHIKLLEDYIQFIGTLSNLLRTLELTENDSFYDFYSNEHNLFKEVRLHDLYIKSKYSQLAKKIRLNLNSRIDDKEILIGKRYLHHINRNKVVISTNLVNGKGVMNIDFSNEDDLIYGIMLDGFRYNLYIYAIGEKEKEKIEIANNLRDTNQWFTFDFLPESEVYPKGKKEYNKYGASMIYRSVKIKTDLNLNDLLDRIYKDVVRMLRISTNANNV
ncbi:PD-(D/E)XK nuclease family protein [Cochleicola gelatinilyticus]|uniref:PD-(D/E)XK nuclease superfamily protein n=1 Tax=Cochleicola gelatinilyticus TaxID=1763537 RepID=A0A167K628_9FLAO|nr:PD-(D/E)XK nuclease family protein [Cochleicola gelatinilyticus]OAB81416.1 hypothetical protein ULVI_01755 [Cochleicola gelatinilyticus]